MHTGSWIRRAASFAPAALTLAAAALPALARIGGGENYEPGGALGGSSGGGGDLSGVVELLVWLAIRNPVVGIPVVAAVVLVLWYAGRNRGAASTQRALARVEAAWAAEVKDTEIEAWQRALQAQDPGFDLGAFYERSRRLFLATQEAWFRRDLAPVRRYLSDATFQRLVVQLGLARAQGVRDAIAAPSILDAKLVGLEQNAFFDTAHVRMRAMMRDAEAPADASDDEARALAMARTPETFTELWSFVRRPGARTAAGADPFAAVCPSCGAPFAGGAANRCDHCGAIVNSGTYDWVLAEITQRAERVPPHPAVEGLARAQAADPGLALEVLEDRAALAFWKWIEAQATGDAAHVARIGAPGFVEALRTELAAPRAAGRLRTFGDCAVGAVDTLRFDREEGLELASVEIRWSARRGTANGETPAELPVRPQRSVMVLARKAGALTPVGNGVATNRCPGCGAPLADNGQASCEYCGVPLASGERDWVIHALTSWESWRAGRGREERDPSGPASLAPPVADRAERARLVFLMIDVAKADGVVEERERGLIRMAADRWGVARADVESALDSDRAPGAPPVAKRSAEAEVAMRDLVAVALVDRKIDARERKLLYQAALHLGLAARFDEFLRPR